MTDDTSTAKKSDNTQDIEKSFKGGETNDNKTPKQSSKEKCRSLMDSNITTSFMTIITFYALFSDDVRVLSFGNTADGHFAIFSSVAFLLFLVEIALNCWCREGYIKLPDKNKVMNAWLDSRGDSKWKRLMTLWAAIDFGGFYLWLDLLATASMIVEMPFLFSGSSGAEDVNTSNLETARAGKASRAGAKAARVVKVVRMIRLVRLVKLYKYFSENKVKKEGNQVFPDYQDDESLDNMPLESHVGAEMSDRTTKKAIVGMLIMLVVIPILQVEDLEYFDEFGMQMIFNRRAAYSTLKDKATRTSWIFSEDLFMKKTSCIQLEYNGFDSPGEMSEFAVIPKNRALPDTLRTIEKTIISINGTNDNDKMNSITAVFDISPRAEEEALLGILLTSFVILLLAIGTMTFSNDVNNLVIIPIEKMVQLVKEISANPLKKDFSIKPEEISIDDGMETTMLLRTISKIAGLLRVGFGEAGAAIIGRNLDMANDGAAWDPAMNLLGNGTKIQSIFAFCDVRNFTDTTECLQEEVMLFVNRIAHILHSIVSQNDGAANKNIGDAFLLTWTLYDSQLLGDGNCQNHNHAGDKALYSLLKTMAEMKRHENFICNFSASALSALYERMPGYKCRMGCGLHFGWAIEGAIGSEKKIDASYISPHVNFVEVLESSTKEYGVPILMSQPFFNLLSPEANKYCRQVDNVKKATQNQDAPIGLYAYDANLDIHLPDHSISNSSMKNFQQSEKRSTVTNRTTAELLPGLSIDVDLTKKKKEMVNSNIKTQMGALGEAPEINLPPFSVDVWETDQDIVLLRAHFSQECRGIWSKGVGDFFTGDWKSAIVHLNLVLQKLGGNDGPTKRLLGIMENHDFICPDDWAGFNEIS